MDREPESGNKFGNVRIFKNQELGHGSYGAVYKAKCDALSCAAKLIYPLLFGSNTSPQEVPDSGREHRQPLRRFEAECRFLSQIKHPNIVQYLGTYRDPETNAPVLLMELMDESLTHFLEIPQNKVLFHIQVNILHDTALALAFLHTHEITHRDLSSNNVLLIAGSRAKLTDFGKSKFADSAAPHLASLSRTPGTPAYMPPEALSNPPKYSEKLDCFSFGVLIVQTITREFPYPADQFQSREIIDSHMRKIQAYIRISELERRQSHISLVPAAHPLRPIALDCLKDRDVERPTAQQLCENLQQLKNTPLYASSIHQIRDRELLIQTQRKTIRDTQKQLQDQRQTIQQLLTIEKENVQLRQVILTKTQENQQLRRQNEQLSTQQQLLQLSQQVQSSEELIAKFKQGMIDKDRQIQQLQTQLQQLELNLDQQQPEVRKKSAPKELELTWRKGPKAPTAMSRGSSTIIGNTVYINSAGSRNIYAFQCTTRQWSTLPQCPYTCSTLTNIENKLTTIGNKKDSSSFQCTNKLITYHDQKWEKLYPPMPTKWIICMWVAVLSTSTHVVGAVGGVGSGGMHNGSTEILYIDSKQWSTASPLPSGIFSDHTCTIALCGETLYLMGGATDSNSDYSVLTCQLRDLVKQPTPSSKLRKQFSKSTTAHSKVWRNIPVLPVLWSACVTVQGHVLAIGGRDKQDKKSSVIYRYDEQRNQWIVVNNNMTIGRSQCLVTVLPDNNLLVIGGITDSGKTDETEVATIA